MPSSWSAWDFIKNISQLQSTLKDSHNVFIFPDPYVERVIVNQIECSSEHKFWGQEFDWDRFEDSVTHLDMFATDEVAVVKNADMILAKDFNRILELDFSALTKKTLWFFSKETTWAKKLEKKGVAINVVETPKFWQNKELLLFFLRAEKVELSHKALEVALQSLEETSESYFQFVSKAKLLYPDKIIEENDIENIIDHSHENQFELSRLFGEKRFQVFFEKIVDLNLTFNELKLLFIFLQSHLLKIADPSYIEKKKRPSKYDKSIQSQSRLWKPIELKASLNFFREIELSAKKRDNFSYYKLQQAYFKSLKV